jgi:hypothetical protein
MHCRAEMQSEEERDFLPYGKNAFYFNQTQCRAAASA